MSEDFKAVFSHDKGVLPLCRREFVFRDDGPSIFFIYEDFVGAHVNHGFDGEDHAWHKEHAALPRVVVVDDGVFVESIARAVASEVAYDRESVLTSVAFDSFSDFSHIMPRLCGFDADFEAFTGAIDETLYTRFYLSDAEHARGISIVAVEDGGDINVEDVAIPQFFVVGGYAVANDLVDARAAVAWEAFIVEGRTDGTVTFGEVCHEAVNLTRGHADANFFFEHIEDGGVDFAGAAYAFNLFGSFDKLTGGDEVAFGLYFEDTKVERSGRCTFGDNPVLSFSCHRGKVVRGKRLGARET